MSAINNAKPLPGIFIYKEVVNERVNNYVNNKLPLLSAAIGKPDSQSGWYSLEQFEELMREMYYLNADGVRLYFGAHSADDPLYPNQLTVIFVPTFLNRENSNHQDIVIENTDVFETRLEVMNELRAKISSTDIKNLDTLTLAPPYGANNQFAYPF